MGAVLKEEFFPSASVTSGYMQAPVEPSPIVSPHSEGMFPKLEADDAEMRRDAWSDFESDHLTDGEGHADSQYYFDCQEAFDKAWPRGREAAISAAEKAFGDRYSKLHPRLPVTGQAQPVVTDENRDLIYAELAKAYENGCRDVHDNYVEDRDPDFKEAAYDYATAQTEAVLKSLTSPPDQSATAKPVAITTPGQLEQISYDTARMWPLEGWFAPETERVFLYTSPPDQSALLAEAAAILTVGLMNDDNAVKFCPVNSEGFAGGDCPKCGANQHQNCGPRVTAAGEFLIACRALLAKLREVRV
jgi:hypothetical protein